MRQQTAPGTAPTRQERSEGQQFGMAGVLLARPWTSLEIRAEADAILQVLRRLHPRDLAGTAALETRIRILQREVKRCHRHVCPDVDPIDLLSARVSLSDALIQTDAHLRSADSDDAR